MGHSEHATGFDQLDIVDSDDFFPVSIYDLPVQNGLADTGVIGGPLLSINFQEVFNGLSLGYLGKCFALPHGGLFGDDDFVVGKEFDLIPLDVF